MKAKSGPSYSLTGNGILVLAIGATGLLLWRATGGAPWATGLIMIILLGLVLTHYSEIITQIEGI